MHTVIAEGPTAAPVGGDGSTSDQTARAWAQQLLGPVRKSRDRDVQALRAALDAFARWELDVVTQFGPALASVPQPPPSCVAAVDRLSAREATLRETIHRAATDPERGWQSVDAEKLELVSIEADLARELEAVPLWQLGMRRVAPATASDACDASADGPGSGPDASEHGDDTELARCGGDAALTREHYLMPLAATDDSLQESPRCTDLTVQRLLGICTVVAAQDPVQNDNRAAAEVVNAICGHKIAAAAVLDV